MTIVVRRKRLSGNSLVFCDMRWSGCHIGGEALSREIVAEMTPRQRFCQPKKTRERGAAKTEAEQVADWDTFSSGKRNQCSDSHDCWGTWIWGSGVSVAFDRLTNGHNGGAAKAVPKHLSITQGVPIIS